MGREAISPTIRRKMNALAEAYFGTASDPDQVPITEASWKKLVSLSPHCVSVRIENDEPVSWIVVIPTTRALMEQFLQRRISERQLFDLTEPADVYETLYFCAAFTIPSHRRRGYVQALLQEVLTHIPLQPLAPLFALAYSIEGRALLDKWNASHERKILSPISQTP